MQANNITEGIRDLTKRIYSTDPIEYNSAINIYCEPNLTFSSTFFSLHGASKVKKALYLSKLVERGRRRVTPSEEKDPQTGFGKRKEWDEDQQILTIHSSTTYGSPFPLPLLDITFTLPTLTILHLNLSSDGELLSDPDADVGMYSSEDEDGTVVAGGDWAGAEGLVKRHQGGREARGERAVEGESGRVMVITKWEERGVLRSVVARIGVVEKMYTSLLLPLLSPTLLLLSSLLLFYSHHPLSNGLLPFALAALSAIWAEATDLVARRVGLGFDGSGLKEVKKEVAKKLPSPGTNGASSSSSSSVRGGRISTRSTKTGPSFTPPPPHATTARTDTATATGGTVHHSGVDAESALRDGTSYAKVAAAEGTDSDGQAQGGEGQGREHHVPTEEGAPSYAAVVAE